MWNKIKENKVFQSPKSGNFESNYYPTKSKEFTMDSGFNPLNRGNLNQI